MTENELQDKLKQLELKLKLNNQKLEEIKRILLMSDWEIFKEWLSQLLNKFFR